MKVIKNSAITVFMIVCSVIMVNKVQASPNYNCMVWNNVNKVQVWNNVSKAQASPDCQTNIWNNFLAANDAYTNAFDPYYANFYSPASPTPCASSCGQSCSASVNPSQYSTQQDYDNALTACASTCYDNCRSSAQSTYYSAQDALSNAASQSCMAQIRLACSEIQDREAACDAQYYNVINGTNDFQIQQAAYFAQSACHQVNDQIPCDN